MPADLTMAEDQTYGLECPEHPEATREGLAPAHATNAVAKHNRDHHPTPHWPDLLNVSALARRVTTAWDEWTSLIQDGLDDPDVAHRATPAQGRYQAALDAWKDLTGLDDVEALAFARHLSASPDWHAAVVPF